MQYIHFNSINSTHKYLLENILTINDEVVVSADEQTSGVGSRGNVWQSPRGNLYFSFSLSKEFLPEDLELNSSSIYFSWIMFETLKQFGSNAIFKWPNDFYINDKKLGGVITSIKGKFLICSMGINTKIAFDDFAKLDVKLENSALLEAYFLNLKKSKKWKEIFNDFALQFQTTQDKEVHIKGVRKSLKNAVLQEDGSLLIDGKKVYSLR